MSARCRAAVVSFVLAVMLAPWSADARITSLVISRTESPTFEGMSFGSVGPYEKLVGRAVGEVDPNDLKNALIVDIALAPRNSRGMVEYSTPVYILRPVNRARGNHRIFLDVNNRGELIALNQFNDAPPSNDPTTAADAGNGFLMRMGYTIVWSGWDITAPTSENRLAMTVPVATNADGSPIVGFSLEEFVIDRPDVLTGTLTYPAATRDKSEAHLTMRPTYADTPRPVPANGWDYIDDRRIRLMPEGTAFQPGSLYEFTYPAKNPRVAGLAFAGLRDLAEFLHYGTADDQNRPNPLAGDVRAVYAFGRSQPARFIHDFLHLGFNADSANRRVFDGILSWIGGASGGFFNYRFAQPGRTHRQHIGRWYPERQFPFANRVINDPVTGLTDGRLARCLQNGTCPKMFEVNSENEYWAKAGSLLHTDTRGQDLADPPNVRHYLLASLPHGPGGASGSRGICQQPLNPLTGNASLRALLVNLDDWVTQSKEPPDSRVPRVANGTLVPPLPQSGVGFPSIPGIVYNGRLHEGDLFDFGASFGMGVLSVVPPRRVGAPYPALVPKTDVDGNDLAGVRTVDVEVPVATYTGWALRAGPAAGDGCDASGQRIDFARTRAERLANGDPRLSVEERYPTHDDYVTKVKAAADRLARERFLLPEDVVRTVERASASSIGRSATATRQ
jgi:alpha/beta hydrolase family protein